MKQTWVIKNKKGDIDAIAAEQGISPVTAQLLLNRDLTTKEERDVYLHPSVCGLREPELLLNAKKAAGALKDAVAAGKHIRIVGDYDVDGITATFVLFSALSEIGAKVDFRIPDRIADGYGVNISMIDEAFSQGVDLILTCDNGISEFDAVKHAKELGMGFILTDHHRITVVTGPDGTERQVMPEADIIVNPHQPGETTPFHDICGCVVAMKVVQLLGADVMRYLPYAAMATLCDVMDLKDENRVIVALGLGELRRTRDAGLSALITANKLERERLSVYHIGFVIGPCLNASGRLDTAEKAERLLLEKNPEKAREAAEELVALNADRKELTEIGANRASFIIDAVAKKQAEFCGAAEEEAENYIDKVIVLNLKDCHESVAGIIAGRIKEKYNRPAFVFTNSGDVLKGSGRSIEAYSMYEELTKVKDLLIRFGGHPMAAGLTIDPEKLPELQQRLNDNCTLDEKQLAKKVRIDMKLPFEKVTYKLLDEIALMEPFGKGNEKVLFAEKDLKVIRGSVIGKRQNMLKLNLINVGGCRFTALYFGDIIRFFEDVKRRFGENELDKMMKGMPNSVVLSATYVPEREEYNGMMSIRAKLVDYMFF
jgi:single-stranded-DNA-specific exonuclease